MDKLQSLGWERLNGHHWYTYKKDNARIIVDRERHTYSIFDLTNADVILSKDEIDALPTLI